MNASACLIRGTRVRAARDTTPLPMLRPHRTTQPPGVAEGTVGFTIGRPFPESVPTAVEVDFPGCRVAVKLTDLVVVDDA